MASPTCPTCSKPLPAGAPLGLCPECLLQAGFPSTAPTGPAKMAHFIAPSIEALAPLFPQLEILGLIGQGGMGAVYRARQPSLDRVIALKILPPQRGNGPAFAERFTREARALARLGHRNIVAVHDFGEAGEYPYLVMEFVDGVNLRHLLTTTKISPREALAIVPQICDALQFAHDAGIVHRDIKPDNILINRQGIVKIADFGLAKILGSGHGDAMLTGARDVMGTPHYMAPEQIEHPVDVDHRADIFSLGVVFYQMLTGELPLGRFAPPSRKVEIDVRLDEVVLRALEKEPEHRYQQASAIKSEVEAIAASPHGAGEEAEEAHARKPRRAWTLRAAALIALLTLSGASVAWLFRAPAAAGRAPSSAHTANAALPPKKPGGVTSESLVPFPEPSRNRLLLKPEPAADSSSAPALATGTAPSPAVPAVTRPTEPAHVAPIPAPERTARETESQATPPRASDSTRRAEAVPRAPTGLGNGHYALSRAPADFDTMEANPEILNIQLRFALIEQDDVRSRRKSGVATDADIVRVNERVALFRAKLDNDRLRFSQIKLEAAQQRLEQASARYDAGILSGRDLDAAREEVEIEKVRVAAVKNPPQDSSSTAPLTPRP